MTSAPLNLTSNRIGRSFSTPDWPKVRFLERPVVRFGIGGLLAFGGALAVLGTRGLLYGRGDNIFSLALTRPAPRPASVTIAFLVDPTAVVFFAAAVLTPMLCAMQVEVIDRFIEESYRNSFWRIDGPSVAELDEIVSTANKRFERMASKSWTLATFAVSAGLSTGIYLGIRSEGPFATWNPTALPRQQWREEAFWGWWAQQGVGAVVLLIAATYFLYFLTKQLYMGWVFAQFAHAGSRINFAPVPNLLYNPDGYWGLQLLRRFMQWTFTSTVVHFVASLCVFVLWLPVSPWTILLAVIIMVLNAITVMYPTVTAMSTTEAMKREFVRCATADHVVGIQLRPLPEDRTKLVDRVWSVPTLPFRARHTLAAIAVYLLAPVSLAILSSLLPSGK